MKQKHFIDIQHIREEDTDIKESNAKCFAVGDIIQITEKWDGSNAAVSYDADNNKLYAFSRKQELSFDNVLNGFWNHVQNFDVELWKDSVGLFVFGEWGNRNKIIYNKEFYKRWYVYDIYDTVNEKWMPQDFVKDFCKKHNLEYIHELYYGPFISWEHAKSFMHSPAYGERQEGIVCKNQTKLNMDGNRHPAYLKIVNDDFKETMKTRVKLPEDPDVVEAKKTAKTIVESVVTKARVEKMIYRLRDEGVFPEKLQPTDMKLVARNLPKAIYEDCIKEEPELVKLAGEYFSKMCGAEVMLHARTIILG